MKKIWTILPILTLSACGWLIYMNWNWVNANFLHRYSQAPNFYLQDYLEKYHSSAEFYGIPLIINLWTTEDSFPADDLRALAQAQEEFRDKITVVGINRGESLSAAKNFTDKIGVSGGILFLLDPEDSFYKSIGGFKTPETIFIDKYRNIVDQKHGTMKLPEIRKRIERIL